MLNFLSNLSLCFNKETTNYSDKLRKSGGSANSWSKHAIPLNDSKPEKTSLLSAIPQRLRPLFLSSMVRSFRHNVLRSQLTSLHNL